MEVEREIESEIIIGRLLVLRDTGKGIWEMVFRRRENISVILVCPKGTVSQKSCVSEELCPIMGCVSKRCLRRAVSQKSCVP